MLTQRYTPTFFLLSSIILGLLISALGYLTTGLPTLPVKPFGFLGSTTWFKWEQVEKDADFKCRKKFIVAFYLLYLNCQQKHIQWLWILFFQLYLGVRVLAFPRPEFLSTVNLACSRYGYLLEVVYRLFIQNEIFWIVIKYEH